MRIFLDNEEWATVPSPVVRDLGIATGDEVLVADLAQRVGEASASRARDRALRALARREHSPAELVRKLRDDGFNASVIDAALAELADAGILDESRFVEALVRTSIAKPLGRNAIVDSLRRHGIDREEAIRLVDDAYPHQVEEECAALLAELLRSRGKPPASVRRALLAKGFGSELAHRASLAATRPDATHTP